MPSSYRASTSLCSLLMASWQYLALLSINIERRFNISAATPVVPLPPKGSMTKPSSGHSRPIKNIGKSTGKTAGCPLFLPTNARLMTFECFSSSDGVNSSSADASTLTTFEGRTVSLPTHLEISRPKPLSLTELCRERSFCPNLLRRVSTQFPIGFRTASGLKKGRFDFAK